MPQPTQNSFVEERKGILLTALSILSRSSKCINRRELAEEAGVSTDILTKYFKSFSELQAEISKLSTDGEAQEIGLREVRADAYPVT